jgi:DNA-binding winged helix-turn-helix (wHTH) protein
MQLAAESNARRDDGVQSERIARSYTFGDNGELEIDLLSYQLRRHGEALPLEPKAFDVLVYLIEHRDRVVPSKELFAKFWPPHISATVLSHYIVVARKAIGDDVERQSMILTVRGRGYRFVGRVLEPSPTLRESMMVPRLPAEALVEPRTEARAVSAQRSGSDAFIGRSEHVAQLEAALRDVLQGQARVLLIAGEAGIGKTRLLEKLGALGTAHGARVLATRYGAGQPAPSFWPLAQDLEQHDDLARFRLFDAITGFLRAASLDQPLVLMLDDVQLADTASLALIKYLVRHMEGARILIALAYRDGVEPVAPETGCARIELRGWTREEVADVLSAATGTRCEGRVAAHVHELTDGNPLFVHELARVLAPRIAAS